MDKISTYLSFIKEKGRALSEINPGSNEFGLAPEDALKAIELLQDSYRPILGGDVLTDNKSEKLKYTYENWYCEINENENWRDYVIRSYDIAKKYIYEATKRSNKKLYIVMVI